MSNNFLHKIIPNGESDVFGLEKVEVEETNQKAIMEGEEKKEEVRLPFGSEKEIVLPFGGKVKGTGRKRVVIEFEEAPPIQMKIAEREAFIRKIGDAIIRKLKIKETGSKEQKGQEARKAAKEEDSDKE